MPLFSGICILKNWEGFARKLKEERVYPFTVGIGNGKSMRFTLSESEIP